MSRVDLAITAGGQGSVQCAMAAGTPLIGIPLQPEQDANVHLLERKGAARMLTQDAVGKGKLPTMMRDMLAEPAWRRAAGTIKEAYARRDGPALSAEAIMRYLADERRMVA
jgi:UDP:flavonoid glycosyltransferase YjiC (YdhE family)